MPRKPSIIYVIEDDKSFLEALSRLIRAWECEVVGMGSIEEFRNVLPLKDNACLVVDLCLKGECGLQVLDELEAKGTSAPTVFISATENLDLVARANEVVHCDFLKKPFEATALFETISRVMRHHVSSLDDPHHGSVSPDITKKRRY